MRKGDCVIMDSRCLHYGSCNSGNSDSDNIKRYSNDDSSDSNNSNNRRVLLYYTIRDPLHYNPADVDVYFEHGSRFDHLNMTLESF